MSGPGLSPLVAPGLLFQRRPPIFGSASRNFGAQAGGSGWIEVPSSINTLIGSTPTTVCSWVYLHTVGNFRPVFTDVYGGGDTNVVMTHGAQNGAQWSSGRFVGGWGGTGVTTPTTGQWTHVSSSWTGTHMKLYVGGTEVSSVSDAREATSVSPWRIGRRWDSSDYIDAQIADLRVFSGFHPAEITAAAAGNPPGINPAGWWLLNSDDVLDHSGNGYHGINYGSTFSAAGPL